MRTLQADVLVIGGGATGAGVLLDLSLRGLRAILVEQSDLATGTSGRYHGLLHSGGRYVVRDAASAQECIEENVIVRHMVPHAIENTSGLFVAMPGDDPAYVEPWIKGCHAVGIPVEKIPVAEALREHPALNPALREAYRVPDASCDSFDLLHALVEGAEAHGGQALTYHRVSAIEVAGGQVKGALLEDRRRGESVRVHAPVIVNAAGPWADEVGRMAGVHIPLRLSKGIMVAMNVRWVNTILNRLDAPGDGDILVPVGTVCVIGTTSVTVPRPTDLDISPDEVTQMLDAGEVLIPGFRRARALRAWAGIRPLFDAPAISHDPGVHDEHHQVQDEEGRWITRTFSVLNHEKDGARGLFSIVGGKLTTFRLMAEKTVDQVCAHLGVSAPCTTASVELPAPEAGPYGGGRRHRGYHALPNRLAALEDAPTHTGLICECEIVTRPELEAAIEAGGAGVSLDDLRRDLRLGMGPCQGGFCAYRAAGILQEVQKLPAEDAIRALSRFVEERFRGNRPLLWGHQLRQALLDESIFRRQLGLTPPAEAASSSQEQPQETSRG
ncbi:MAG: anaerobic glycerol-3-phosphate dehydrogenase subunit A [Anaerolineae bacterium]|nr:anaerobic glycerol-3-phosphate dehydrogenase subunit A [Anaerolineae bacterium]